MSLNRWTETLIVAQGDGTQISNSAVAASLLPAQAKLTFPNGFFGDVGKMLRIKAAGRLSNVVTTPGTFTFDVRLGATVVFNMGAQQLSTTAHTNVPWWLEIYLTLRAAGASANFIGQAIGICQAFASTAVADNAYTHSSVLLPNTAPAVGSNFDATATQQLDLFGTFSVATNPTNATLHQFSVESMN